VLREHHTFVRPATNRRAASLDKALSHRLLADTRQSRRELLRWVPSLHSANRSAREVFSSSRAVFDMTTTISLSDLDAVATTVRITEALRHQVSVVVHVGPRGDRVRGA